MRRIITIVIEEEPNTYNIIKGGEISDLEALVACQGAADHYRMELAEQQVRAKIAAEGGAGESA